MGTLNMFLILCCLVLGCSSTSVQSTRELDLLSRSFAELVVTFKEFKRAVEIQVNYSLKEIFKF